MTNSNSHLQTVQQNCQEKTKNSGNPLSGGSQPLAKISIGNFKANPEGFQPTESTDDAAARANFWSIQHDFIYRHHNEPRVQLHVPEERNIPHPTEKIMLLGLFILM